MEIEFITERVSERDIDLFIINKFMNDDKFKEIFLRKIKKEKFEVVSCIHSYKDNDGESDITIILSNSEEKIALLIEDKINAIAMPNQRKRYDYRGDNGIKEGKYNEYYVFIIAPKEYLISNTEAKKYKNQISYEEILEFINDSDKYGKALLKNALEEKKKGYIIQEDINVTKFWEEYYKYVDINYKELNIRKYSGARGSNAWWPGFQTPVKYIWINHKSDRGFIDLSFPGVGEYYNEISNILEGKLDEDMSIVRTNKSMSIRIKVPIVRFNENFEKYTNEMKICLDSVVRLQNLLSRIEYKKILDLSSKNIK